MINELDLVVLKRDLPTERLTAGDVGTVVLVHQQGAGYEVEFTTLSGDTVAVVNLDASDVRPVEAREIVHARRQLIRQLGTPGDQTCRDRKVSSEDRYKH
jgi:hypothetical protein